MRSLLLPFACKRIEGMLILLLAIAGLSTAELTLIHEVGGGHAHGWVGWGYTLLPSTFPLTWDEAREACEVIPGSMLARVEEWEGEAALAEYLKTLHMKDPLWLANRQTLPEVLQDEQREMNHLSGGRRMEEDVGGGGDDDNGPGDEGPVVDLTGSDLTVGGDVGVTLRCAIYILGIGIVHELCSSRTVSAALCVQRLSGDRPLSIACPPSVHHTWLLVNRQIQSTTVQGDEDTTVTVTGLQQCRHHILGQTYCHLKNGWSKAVCPPDAPFKHHRGKKNHKYHHNGGHGHLRQFHKASSLFQETNTANIAEKSVIEGQEYLKTYSSNNRRSKRQAQHGSNHPPSHFPSVPESQEKMMSSHVFLPAPLAKEKPLDLDLIQSIMQDLSPKKKKKKNNRTGRKNDRVVPQSQKIPQITTEEEKTNKTESTQVIKSPTTNSPEILQTTIQEPVGDHTVSEQSSSPNVKNTSNAGGNPSNTSTESVENTKTEDTSKDATEVTTSEDTSVDTSKSDNKEDPTAVTNQSQNVEGEKEESGPSIMVGVGPIFVEDAMAELEFIEAAVAEEPMDESMMGEEVMLDINSLQKNLNATAKNPIVFPEIPIGVIPDPTPRSNVATDKSPKGNPMSEDVNVPKPSASFTEILFPGNENPLPEINPDHEVIVETSIDGSPTSATDEALQSIILEKPDGEAMTEKPGSGDENMLDMSVKDDKSDVAEKPMMENEEAKKDMESMEDEEDMENMGEKEEMEAMGEKEEMEAMGEKEEMEAMEEKEEIETMGKKEEMETMGEKEEMEPMEEKEEIETMGKKEEMENMGEKEEMEAMEEKEDMETIGEKKEMEAMEEKEDMETMGEKEEMEAMEEKEDIENMEEKQDIETKGEKQDTESNQDEQSVSEIELQNKEEEMVEMSPSKGQGKQVLLGQILKGIFG